LISGCCAGAAAQPRFEVASVKRTDNCGGVNSADPGTVVLRGVPLKPVLTEAFGVGIDQIEGPSWLETDCFDISATIPQGATRDQLADMLESLLRERFKLVAHKQDRPRAGYALVVDKGGPRVKEDDPKTSFMRSPSGQQLTAYGANGHGALKGVMTMAMLASNLSREGYGPIEDLTGLAGRYDIDLSWTPDLDPAGVGATASTAGPPGTESPATAESEGSLFAALRNSLGLRLERRQIPVQFVVIDHIERVPTEN